MCVENKLFVCLFQDDISVLLVEKEELLHNIISGNQPVFVCEKAVSQFVIAPIYTNYTHYVPFLFKVNITSFVNLFYQKQPKYDAESTETSADTSVVEEILYKVEQDLGPLPLSVMKAR